jgi:hypothetical protein
MTHAYVVKKTFNIAVPGKEPVTFKEGELVGRRAYRAIPAARFQPYFEKVTGVQVNEGPRNRRSSTRNPMSDKELFYLAALWISHADLRNNTYDRVVIRDRFQSMFPDRADSTIHLTLCQIKGADLYYKASGLKPTKKLMRVLSVIDSDRFQYI